MVISETTVKVVSLINASALIIWDFRLMLLRHLTLLKFSLIASIKLDFLEADHLTLLMVGLVIRTVVIYVDDLPEDRRLVDALQAEHCQLIKLAVICLKSEFTLLQRWVIPCNYLDR